MFQKLLNSKAQSISSAAIIIGVTSLASRILGVVRDRVLAGEFGAGSTLDAYYAAFRIPDTIFNLLILGALSAGFIPIFSELIESNKDRAWKLANNVLNAVIVLMIMLGAVLFFLTPQLMSVIAPGFNGELMELATQLTRIMFLSPLLLGVSSLFGGVLQSMKRFLMFSLAPIFYNIGIILGALLFSRTMGPIGLAYGVILGAALHLLVQLPSAMINGYRYHFTLNIFNADFKHAVKLMVPRMLSLSVSQVNLTIITILASTLSVGSLAIYNFSNNLQAFPLSLFGISFAIAAFPTLCELGRKDGKEEFSVSISNTTRQILFFIIPVSILFIVLRAQIVRVVLGAGKFDWDATITTADTLALFSISLFAQALIPLLNRGFFALKNSITPFIIGLFSEGAMLYLALHVTKPFIIFGMSVDLGVRGLALAFTVASLINFLLLWVLLRIKVGTLHESKIFFSIGKVIIASFVMAIVVQFMKFGVEPYFGTETFMGVFLQGFISGIVGIAVFVVVGLLLKSEELSTFLSSIKRRMFKERRPVASTEGLDIAVD